MKPKPQPRSAIAPAPWEDADAYAIQALMRGEANESQQRRAFAWIYHQACRTNDVSFRGENTHDSAFAEGRRFVGLQIDKLTRINPSALKKGGPEREPEPKENG